MPISPLTRILLVVASVLGIGACTAPSLPFARLAGLVTSRQLDEISGLAAHIARAAPLFAKLGRFGRVAVVADQVWIRALTRIESALLPHISYRVFKPEDRGAALTWVEGRN